MRPKKILITGVYGLIGGLVYRRFHELPKKFEVYALDRTREPSERTPDGWKLHIPDERFHLANLSDFVAIQQAMQGMEMVVHLAGTPDPHASWEAILANNVIGTYHIFEACREAGVRRVVLASSLMVSAGYELVEPYKAIKENRFEDVPAKIPVVTHEMPCRPTEPYSASKVWGEGLARLYADVHGLSCICLRLGWVNADDHPGGPDYEEIWCSQRDAVQLVERCVDAPDALRFDIFYGVSNNRYRWVDIDHAREKVGYIPQDRAKID